MAESDDGMLVVLGAAAAVIVSGYSLDLAGMMIRPVLLGAAAVLAGGVAVYAVAPLRHGPRWAAVLPYLVAFVSGAYAFWIASPALLPVTNGPDVVHHLQLIHVIAATGRLPHDPAQYPYLLEMMNYTPGAHILAAAVAAWMRVDPLVVVYPIAASAFGIKSALLYEIARRVLQSAPRAALHALAAPVLAFVPVYYLGSFVQFFFFSQVVSETFALGMVLALICWQARPVSVYLWFASACAAGVVLSWPIWIVPSGVAALHVARAGAPRWRDRTRVLSVALGPAVAFGALHHALHRDAASIVTAAGAVTAPSLAVFGGGFLVLAAAGLVPGVRERDARPVFV